MSDGRTALDLMVTDFRRIGSDQSLRDAMNLLLAAAADPSRPAALVVEEADGAFAGLLTPRLLFKAMLALWMPGKDVREDEQRLEKELLDVVTERFDHPVSEAMVRGLATASPDARLKRMIELVCDQRLGFLPVIEDDRAIGLVPVTEIFRFAAALALRRDQSGPTLEGRTTYGQR